MVAIFLAYSDIRYKVGTYCLTLPSCPFLQGLKHQGDHRIPWGSQWGARRQARVMCCPVSRSFTLKSTDVKSIEEVRYGPLETAQIVGVNVGVTRVLTGKSRPVRSFWVYLKKTPTPFAQDPNGSAEHPKLIVGPSWIVGNQGVDCCLLSGDRDKLFNEG